MKRQKAFIGERKLLKTNMIALGIELLVGGSATRTEEKHIPEIGQAIAIVDTIVVPAPLRCMVHLVGECYWPLSAQTKTYELMMELGLAHCASIVEPSVAQSALDL